MKEYGAIVVGGGPAGAAAATALTLAGHSTLVIERSQYQEWRAGETLPPAVRLPLRKLGVWDQFLREGHLPSYAIHAAWGSEEIYETNFIFNAFGTGWHVDRYRFDSMLANWAQQCGVTLLKNSSVKAVFWDAEGWKVEIEGNGLQTVSGSFLVDATGRAARIGTLLGVPRITLDQMIGIVGLYEHESPSTELDPILMLESSEEGWWYSVPLPNGHLLVTYMTDADLFSCPYGGRTAFWLEKLRKTVNTLERTEGFRWTGKLRIRSAATSCLQQAGGRSWMAVGDAASAYDPLSADGINKALEQGLRAALLIQNPVAGPTEYGRFVAESFGQYRRLRCEYYRRETRWPASSFWQRRQSDPFARGANDAA